MRAPGPHQPDACHLQSSSGTDRRALAEDRIVDVLDAIQDLRVQRECRRDTRLGSRVEEFDALAGESVDPTGGGMLLCQRTSYAGVGAFVRLAPQQDVTVDAVGGQFVGGQIHPATAQILVDVPQKVSELERFSKCCGVRCSFVAGSDGAENGKHLQADRLGRAVHVAFQRGPVGIVRHGQVHPHRRQEVIERLPGDAVPAGRVHDSPQRGIIAALLVLDELIEQLRGQALKSFGTLGRAEGGVEVVENVIGAAGESVERMDRRPLLGREQPGGEEERTAVLRVEHPAPFVGVAQGRIVHTGGVELGANHVRPLPICVATFRVAAPVIRSAASLPESRAVGTPTPGTVDDPASTTFSIPRTVLAGRNGPVWAKVCASANGVPAAIPCLAQSAGLTT